MTHLESALPSCEPPHTSGNNHPHLLASEEMSYAQAIMECHVPDYQKLALMYEAAIDYWQRIQTLESQIRMQAETLRQLHLWNEQQARTIRILLAKQKEPTS